MKARQASAVALGLLGAGAALYGTHRATQATARLLLQVDPVPPGEPGGLPVLPPEGTPIGDLIRIDFDPARIPVQIGSAGYEIVHAAENTYNFFTDQLNAYRAVNVNFNIDALGIFGQAWGLVGDWVSFVLGGVRDYAAELLGLATGDALKALAGGVSSLAHRTSQWISDVNDGLNRLSVRVDELTRGVAAGLSEARLGLIDLRDLATGIAEWTQANFVALFDRVNLLSSRIDGLPLPQEIPDLSQLPAEIADIVTNLWGGLATINAPTLITIVAPAVAVDVLGQIQPQLDAIRRQAEDSQSCCDAATGRLNDNQPNLDKLKDLLGLLAGLLLIGSMDEILAAITAFLDGQGVGIEHQIADWLGVK